MNIEETTQALALAQAFDNRTVGEVNIRAWFSVLFRADAEDVMAAIRDHYAGTTEWIMPAHILRAVREIVQKREAAANATPWAAGQYGVLKADAVPELAGPVDESTLTPQVRDLLQSVRAMLPEGSREALMPRTVTWEREHRAYLRSQDGEPNPLYHPQPVAPEEVQCPYCPATSQDLAVHVRDYHDRSLSDSDGFCTGGASCTHRHRD